jgi:uncharacterized protein (TIGR00369 family)
MAKIDFELLKQFFQEAIPFNKHLGLQIEKFERGSAIISVEMRKEFIGDPMKQILHGGVISSMIDVTGGATGFSVLDWPRETSLNTIDMRIDYVRMGKGEKFFCEGSIIRKGNRIVVTRCDLKNEEGTLIALGTATYNIFSNPQDIPANVREAAEHILGEK